MTAPAVDRRVVALEWWELERKIRQLALLGAQLRTAKARSTELDAVVVEFNLGRAIVACDREVARAKWKRTDLSRELGVEVGMRAADVRAFVDGLIVESRGRAE